jgi:restriction system protein
LCSRRTASPPHNLDVVKKEARRDGAPPIELVDGDDLVALFENLEFGLRPRKTFDVDDKFFDEFR